MLKRYNSFGMLYKAFLFITYSVIGITCEAKNGIQILNINPDLRYQTIDNFTASDAWSGGFVGEYWSANEKNKISQWLFSSKLDSLGNPLGIGLSMWRVNLGAGTLEQDGADIKPIQRRAESFLVKDGSRYDWNKCKGQQFFMEQARKYGCNKFLLFSNSPLVQYTKNGKGWSNDFNANLLSDCYTRFANYLTIVAEHFINMGYNINYISPINEPQVNWINPRQEGTPWNKSEMKRFFIELDKSLTEKGLDTKILVGECADYACMYGDKKSLYNNFKKEEAPDNMIFSFFCPESRFYVGDLKHVASFIGGHAYWTHSSNEALHNSRIELRKELDKYKVGFQQTEWCMLPGLKEPMDGFKAGWHKDNYAGMDVALLLGRLIYSDMVDANSTGWGYWKAMELKGNHALISLYANNDDIYKGGKAVANKILWGLGNYSLFVRPGYRRIELNGADDLASLVASAYLSSDNKRIVVVCVNSSYTGITYRMSLPSKVSHKIKSIKNYCTSCSMDLAPVPYNKISIKSDLFIPGRSLETIVIDL